MSEQAATFRSDPLHVLPAELPREFCRYDTPVTILGAGQPGKVGLLELVFAFRDGRSRLIHRYQQPPLHIFQPLYYDPERPDMAIIMVLQSGGGMLQGDRYRLDITCRVNAAAHITTQSAGKLYRCDENFITQIVNITAEAGSFVEYLPDLTIPFRGSRFFQRTALRIAPSATVIVGEILTPGRTAHGEHHDYDIFSTQMEARDPDGRLLVVDTIKLEPAISMLHGPAVLGDFAAFGVLYCFSQRMPPAELTDRLRRALADDPKVASRTLCGVSALPNDCGVSVRILGSSGAAVAHARHVAWNAARQALLGVPALDLRKA